MNDLCAVLCRGWPGPSGLDVLYAEWSEAERHAEDGLARFTLAALNELRAATVSLG